MAEEEATTDEEEKPSGGKKKIIIMALGAIALVGAGIGGTIFFMGGGEDVAAVEEVEEPPQTPIYVALDPTFVVNYKDSNSQSRFLKAELNLMTFEEEVEEAITKHMPLIRNNLVMLFNRQVFEDLLNQEGKDVFRAAALSQVQDVMQKHLGRPGIEELFFTTFVMQ